MKDISQKEIKAFQKKILSWYNIHKRDLPWRNTRDPYNILLSEIMLQQTQVSRVIPKYEAWLKAFPTLTDLVNAKTAEILRLWSGLGYNRRVLFLQKAAQTIVFDHDREWPQEVEELKKLPGIGDYTARAVACFAFGKDVAVVDTNVKKVILIELFQNPNLSVSPKELQQVAEKLLPTGKAYEWNQALMDYASAVLKKEKIPVAKQSTYKTSKRFVRGKIIKLLIEHSPLSREELYTSLQPDITVEQATWFDGVLQDLVKEGFLKRDGEKYLLA